MKTKLLISQLQHEMPIGADEVFTIEDLVKKWAEYFNDLIQNDFPKLVGLFYRIDIAETKLRRVLRDNPDENAGKLIADLVIERLLQKIRSREAFHSKPDLFTDEPGAEKW